MKNEIMNISGQRRSLTGKTSKTIKIIIHMRQICGKIISLFFMSIFIIE
jgi:hypothetical protein